MATQASAPAVKNPKTTTKPVAPSPRAFVPPIEFSGNIDKMKLLLKAEKFAEVADTFVDNGLMPEFVFKDLVRNAPREIPAKLLVIHSDFVHAHLSSENVEKRGKRMSALLRAAACFEAKIYFAEKLKLQTAIKAASAKVPSIVTSSCEEIEDGLKHRLSDEDWEACGFKIKAANSGQLVIFHPGLKQSITIYKKVGGPQTEAEKAKAREARESKQRANQLARAAMYPGKTGGGGGGHKEESGKKKGKKK